MSATSSATHRSMSPSPAAPVSAQASGRRDWARAWRAIKALYRDSERTDQVFEILDALEGPLGEDGYQEFVSDPDGRQLLKERPNLLAELSDHEALGALPEGSFGRAYLAFMEEAGLSAQGLIEADNEAGGGPPELDEDRRWLADRGRDSHDLWHVLTGYGRDEAGEVGLLAFTYANYPNLGILMILVVAALIGPKTLNFGWECYLWQAYRRGRAANLDFARYEQWLPLSLEEVRALAGIVPPELAHPTTGIISGAREGGTGLAFGVRPE